MRSISIIIFITFVILASSAYTSSYSARKPVIANRSKPMRCIFTTNYSFGSLRNIYACEISGLLYITRRATTLSSVDGEHLSGRKSTDIQAFKADASVIHFMPENLSKFFPNLIAILLNLVQLKEIRQADLKPYPELMYLDLFENKLEFLEAGVFKYNTKLEILWLSNNKIKFIDDTAFDGVKSIKSLYMGYNDCISKSVNDNLERLSLFFDLIKVVCGNKSKNAIYDPKLMVQTNDDYDDAEDMDDPASGNQTDTEIKSLQLQLRTVEDEVTQLKKKREQALMWLVLKDDENRSLLRSQNDSQAEISKLKDQLRRAESTGTDYVKQIFGLREDLRKQTDATSGIIGDIKNKMAVDQDNLKYQKEENLKLRGQTLKLADENRLCRDNYDSLKEDKDSRDLMSVVVIMLLGFGLVGVIGFLVYKKISAFSEKVGTYNDFENASLKLVNEGPSGNAK